MTSTTTATASTDSVWLDLGYPARKDSSGRLYKPLFAFMVIGLNGRIPLNTAGNLAAQVGGCPAERPDVAGFAGWRRAAVVGTTAGAGHASHLGNSVSEVDPTYGLQNAFDPDVNLATRTGDPLAAFDPPQLSATFTPARHDLCEQHAGR